jgi:hypothetical protein
MRKAGTFVGLMLASVGAAVALAAPAGAATVTVAPKSTDSSNCLPFGSGAWAPNAGFIYKNIPAFTLARGDTIAFDTKSANDTDIQFDVGLSPTTVNGGDIPTGAFTKVVSNTQQAASPRGDTTVGDFDLKYTVQAPFSFPGGGLVIRFSNPSAAFAADNTCPTVDSLVGADATDTSGFFVDRFMMDPDGLAPFDNEGNMYIGAFQVANVSSGSGGGGTGTGTGTGKPVISSFSLSRTKFRAASSGGSVARHRKRPPVGTKVSFSLSEAASVKFTVQRKTKGRKVNGKCKTKTHKNRKKKSCTLYKSVRGSFTASGKAGKNTFTFRGRIGGKALRPGTYRLSGTATDPAKNASVPKLKGFKIVR